MDTSQLSKILDYINANPIATLGTLDDDDTPYGAVVYVCPDPTHAVVYFLTKNKTRKYKNLYDRPSVSVTIVNPEENSTLQAKGQAKVIHDAAIIDFVMKQITRAHAASNEWLPPIAKLRAGEYTLVGVTLSEARLAEYKHGEIGATSRIFTMLHQ